MRQREKNHLAERIIGVAERDFFVVYQQSYDSLGVTGVLQPLLMRHPHAPVIVV